MMRKLIVVDMLKDFLLPGGKLSISSPTEDTTKKLREDAAEYIQNFEGRVYLIMDKHKKGDPEFDQFPEHCVEDTEGAELIDEIKNNLPEGATIIPKVTFNSDSIPPAVIPHNSGQPEIHVIGVCTHICVHDTVAQIANTYKERWGKIADITVHKDLCGDFDPEMAEMCLKRLQNLYGVKVI